MASNDAEFHGESPNSKKSDPVGGAPHELGSHSAEANGDKLKPGAPSTEHLHSILLECDSSRPKDTVEAKRELHKDIDARKTGKSTLTSILLGGRVELTDGDKTLVKGFRTADAPPGGSTEAKNENSNLFIGDLGVRRGSSGKPQEKESDMTTMAVGEEGSASKPDGDMTTMAVGEEGSAPKPDGAIFDARIENRVLPKPEQGDRVREVALPFTERQAGGDIHFPSKNEIRESPIDNLLATVGKNQEALTKWFGDNLQKIPFLGFHGTNEEGRGNIERTAPVSGLKDFYLTGPLMKDKDLSVYMTDLARSFDFALGYAMKPWMTNRGEHTEPGAVLVFREEPHRSPGGGERISGKNSGNGNEEINYTPGFVERKHQGEWRTDTGPEDYKKSLVGNVLSERVKDLFDLSEGGKHKIEDFGRYMICEALRLQAGLLELGKLLGFKAGEHGTGEGGIEHGQRRPGAGGHSEGPPEGNRRFGDPPERGNYPGGGDATTMAVGEEGSAPKPEGGEFTTMAIGEEGSAPKPYDGGGDASTMAIGEEGSAPKSGGGDFTTMAVGEEGSAPKPYDGGDDPPMQRVPQPDIPGPRLEPEPERERPDQPKYLKPQPDKPGDKKHKPGDGEEDDDISTDDVSNPILPPGLHGMDNGEEGRNGSDHIDKRKLSEPVKIYPDGTEEFAYHGTLTDKGNDSDHSKAEFDSKIFIGPDGKTVQATDTTYNPPVDQVYVGKGEKADERIILDGDEKTEIKGVERVTSVRNEDNSYTSIIYSQEGTYIFQMDDKQRVTSVTKPK